MAERAREVTELKRNLAKAIRDKEQLQEVKQQIFGSSESKLCPIRTYEVQITPLESRVISSYSILNAKVQCPTSFCSHSYPSSYSAPAAN